MHFRLFLAHWLHPLPVTGGAIRPPPPPPRSRLAPLPPPPSASAWPGLRLRHSQDQGPHLLLYAWGACRHAGLHGEWGRSLNERWFLHVFVAVCARARVHACGRAGACVCLPLGGAEASMHGHGLRSQPRPSAVCVAACAHLSGPGPVGVQPQQLDGLRLPPPHPF